MWLEERHSSAVELRNHATGEVSVDQLFHKKFGVSRFRSLNSVVMNQNCFYLIFSHLVFIMDRKGRVITKKFALDLAWSLAKFRLITNVQKKRFYSKPKSFLTNSSKIQTSTVYLKTYIELFF